LDSVREASCSAGWPSKGAIDARRRAPLAVRGDGKAAAKCGVSSLGRNDFRVRRGLRNGALTFASGKRRPSLPAHSAEPVPQLTASAAAAL